ncbi:putative P-loop containing nucleoside triphosphate hydrolase, leucine-rich repeat domain superfamily [Helianthus annuus]|nr:putative P-loop containing nucleoside triphosphate hydrolase, leucine-rich repeat domain superfamily [Helianthus annuus]
MAEIVASALLNAIFDKLADEALRKLVRSQGLHSELKKLGRTLSQIQALINDASQKEISDESVKQWLNSLQHLAYDIDDTLDDMATQAMHREFTEESYGIRRKVRKLVPACCTNVSLSNRLRHKLDDITTKLEDLVKEKNSLGLMVKDERLKNMSRRNETSLPDASSIVGRHIDKEKLLSRLLADEPCDQNFSIVPIVGIGGIGKTTLARLLYNESQVKSHFELKAWVCVSDEFDIFKISKTIFQAVSRENKEFEDLNLLQMALAEQIKNKRFLLVLDDVWSENYGDWEILVRPFHSGASGSKIIITTRKERLLKKLGLDHLDHLKSLSHDDAMSLFAQHALGADNFDSHPTLRPLGEGIVKKCGGLPLALRALGRLLRTKITEEDWDDVLNSVIWEIEGVDEIVPALRLSYHDLPACLKQLFAYCSLFPKDFVFDKDELILLWLAEGFLNQSTTNKSIERLGHEYFENLLSRSFFQHAPNEESLFVMHDLMNDLATFVAGDTFFRVDNQMEMKKEILAKYRHISFVREKYVAYQKFEAFKGVKSLRTFLAVSTGAKQVSGHFYLSSKILVDLLPGLSLLRVLCLSCFQISEVPEFIGYLRHLRYLNLSRTQIKELPENVGNLYNLQTLIVFSCWSLTKLPKSLLKLKSLRHFDIRDTPFLTKTPLMIGKLKNLQTLTKIIIGEDDGSTIDKLKDVKNLHGKTSIKRLDKVQTVMHAGEANLSLKNLTELELEWDDVFGSSRNETLEKDVLNMLNPHSDKLRKLEIFSYGGIEFPDWVGDQSFRQLVHVSICDCRKCTNLPALGQLPLLKKLIIRGMDGVEVVGLELLGNTGVAFPSLETLIFGNMQSWEVWSINSWGAHEVFPCLQELHITCCPILVDVSLETIPTLRVLIVTGCDYRVVRSLVRANLSITRLEIEYISGLTDEMWLGVMEHLGAVEELRIQEIKRRGIMEAIF